MRWNLFSLVVVVVMLSVKLIPFGGATLDGLQIQMNWKSPPAIVLVHYKGGTMNGIYAVMIYTDSTQCTPFAFVLDNGKFRIQKRTLWR